MMKRLFSLLLAASSLLSLRADEGMWPLTLLQKIQDPMQARGLKLTAEQIYSINNASVKDAVVRLMSNGRMFCSGEIVSDKGLFLTNHHCGYGAIQELATPKDNILANGFWAKSLADERRANFQIGLLRKIEDVTARVTAGTQNHQDESTRATAISLNIRKVQSELIESLGDSKKNYVVDVAVFYGGNQFLAMFYEVYRDIRLVGTPPENVGKFGGETDNWRWPRHTCDFAMFRIYANGSNDPADFSESNAPYKPKHHFPVSLKGYQEGDYAMTMGYPGRTTRNTYSEGVQYLSQKERPMRVALRRSIMDVYEEYMKADKDVRLMYSDKLAGLGNYWNKFNGEAKELSKPQIYANRKAEEKEFEAWVVKNNKQDIYGEVTSLYDQAYAELNKIGLYNVYLQDGIANSVPMVNALRASGLYAALSDKTSDKGVAMAAQFAAGIDDSYKEFNAEIEVRVLEAVLRHITKDLDPTYLPESLKKMVAKHKGDYAALSKTLWKKSMFADPVALKKFFSKPKAKTLAKDPIFIIVSDYLKVIREDLAPRLTAASTQLSRAERLFLAAKAEMYPDKVVAPDANATMRLSYGTVKSYNARDAVKYTYYTTSKGILEKYIPGDFEFDAPKELIEMVKKKDFGPYKDAGTGELHACFLSDNDITGGNSGSPVINGNGELIGIAFDGNWEAIASDYGFMPDVQRTISVDIRYVLFIVDKLGGASHLVNEMSLR
jgi:V8-like Glu-specific endopeptidase